jgi:hypothetical protein
MSDADDSDIGEAVEALGEILSLKALRRQYVESTIQGPAAHGFISRNNWKRQMMRYCAYIISYCC